MTDPTGDARYEAVLSLLDELKELSTAQWLLALAEHRRNKAMRGALYIKLKSDAEAAGLNNDSWYYVLNVMGDMGAAAVRSTADELASAAEAAAGPRTPLPEGMWEPPWWGPGPTAAGEAETDAMVLSTHAAGALMARGVIGEGLFDSLTAPFRAAGVDFDAL